MIQDPRKKSGSSPKSKLSAMGHVPPLHKISSKSVHNFCHILHTHRQLRKHYTLCDILYKRLRNTLTYLLTYFIGGGAAGAQSLQRAAKYQ